MSPTGSAWGDTLLVIMGGLAACVGALALEDWARRRARRKRGEDDPFRDWEEW